MLYLVKKLSLFEDIQLTANIPGFPPSRMVKPDGMAGFLPVFADVEDALDFVGGDINQIHPIEFVKKE